MKIARLIKGYEEKKPNVYVFNGNNVTIELMIEIFNKLLKNAYSYVNGNGFKSYMSGKKLIIVPQVDPSYYEDPFTLDSFDIDIYSKNYIILCNDNHGDLQNTFKILVCRDTKDIESINRKA